MIIMFCFLSFQARWRHEASALLGFELLRWASVFRHLWRTCKEFCEWSACLYKRRSVSHWCLHLISSPVALIIAECKSHEACYVRFFIFFHNCLSGFACIPLVSFVRTASWPYWCRFWTCRGLSISKFRTMLLEIILRLHSKLSEHCLFCIKPRIVCAIL